MSSLDGPEMACRQCKKVRSAFSPICPHCGIGPEGPTVEAPDHRREITQMPPAGDTFGPSWFRSLVRG
jgi:hypothetical protein